MLGSDCCLINAGNIRCRPTPPVQSIPKPRDNAIFFSHPDYRAEHTDQTCNRVWDGSGNKEYEPSKPFFNYNDLRVRPPFPSPHQWRFL